jgi:hypothetical protein
MNSKAKAQFINRMDRHKTLVFIDAMDLSKCRLRKKISQKDYGGRPIFRIDGLVPCLEGNASALRNSRGLTGRVKYLTL